VFEQHRTLECKHSINDFHKQVNLVERTWDDNLRAMSCNLGIAIVVPLGIEGQWALAQVRMPGPRPSDAVRKVGRRLRFADFSRVSSRTALSRRTIITKAVLQC
jgi:hypothetical protein